MRVYLPRAEAAPAGLDVQKSAPANGLAAAVRTPFDRPSR